MILRVDGKGAGYTAYATSKDGADKVVADITRREGRAVAVRADVSQEPDVRRLFAEAKKAFGRVDILVNNAGIQHVSSVEDFPPAKWDAIMLAIAGVCLGLIGYICG